MFVHEAPEHVTNTEGSKRQNINIPINGEKILEKKAELIKEIEDNVHADSNKSMETSPS